MASNKVEYTVRQHASWQIPMDVTGAPDTSNPEVPSFGMVRPTALGLGIMPSAKGVWEVTSVGVSGPKVKDGKVATKRDYSVMFMDPLGPDSVAPEWVREICQEYTDKANGASAGAGSPLTDQQVYDLNNRLRSNLGLQSTREVLEGVLGTAPVREEVREPEPTNYARQAFDTALNGLLIRENLEGTQWAIEQLREMAKGPELGASGLNHIADGLAEMLDKRTAELAARGNWGLASARGTAREN
jgi:hypothetical protein